MFDADLPDRAGSDRAVVQPAGAPLLDAAAWVGASCHLELLLHGRLTAALAAGVGPERVGALWAIRAHRAELAEAWHRRLPELRELPRETLVRVEGPVEPRLAAPAGGDPADDPAWVADALDALAERYLRHAEVAVGPADAPVADALARALAVTAEDRLLLG